MLTSKLFLLATPLVLLLAVPHNLQSAFAWDFGSLFNGFNGFHYWPFNNYGQGYQPHNNGYQAGIADAQYDHQNNLVYNPYPACCHSQIYSDDFKRGYDQQWNTYQSQEQQTDQHTNIYINNSPGAYVNTQQTSGQNHEQEPSLSPQCEQCLRSDNTNGDCSNGCPWGQGP